MDLAARLSGIRSLAVPSGSCSSFPASGWARQAAWRRRRLSELRLDVQGPRWRRAGDGETESRRLRVGALAPTLAVEFAAAGREIGAKRRMGLWVL